MKKIFLLIVLTSMLSCKQKIKEADISNLNGYWEIEKVDLPDGDKKEYKVNETIDFFKIENKKGFRKKVMPQLDGTYLTNDHICSFGKRRSYPSIQNKLCLLGGRNN